MQLNSVQRIHYSDFPVIDTQYPFLNGIYNQLYKFYFLDGYSQKNEYLICRQRDGMDQSLQELAAVEDDDADDGIRNCFYVAKSEEYASFGIQLEGAPPLVTKRNYILFLTEEEASSDRLGDIIDERKAELGIFEFTHAIFCYDVCNDIGADQVSQLLEICPDLVIVNNTLTKFESISFDRELTEKYNAVDITMMFERLNFDEYDVNRIYSDINDLYCSIRDLDEFVVTTDRSGKSIRRPALYFIDVDNTDWSSVRKKKVHQVYYAIAALVNRNCRKYLHVPDYSYNTYLNYVRNLSSREYNYLDDYLEDVSNPLEIGVRIVNSIPYIFVLNYNELNNKLVADPACCMPELTMTMVPFDLTTNRIDSDGIEKGVLRYSQISTINIAQHFGLDSDDFAQATKGFHKLQLLISEIEYEFQKKFGQVWRTPLDCSNMLLFTLGSKAYIAHVSSISAIEVPYLVIPLVKSYTNFPMQLSHADIASLYDLSIFYECDYIIHRYKTGGNGDGGLIPGNKVHHKISRTCKGLLLSSVPCTTYRVTSDCGFSFEEVGMWMSNAAQLRAGGMVDYVNSVPLQSLRALRGLTFYGGCHPSITTAYTLDANALGGLINARKVLGGYVDV